MRFKIRKLFRKLFKRSKVFHIDSHLLKNTYKNIRKDKTRKVERLNSFKNFGYIVYKHRVVKKWTQSILAYKARLKQSDISLIEKGEKNITLYTLIRLCKALDIDHITF